MIFQTNYGRNTQLLACKIEITSVLSGRLLEQHDEQIDEKLKEKAEELNWNGIDFPVSWEGIKKFERLNEIISVNVYGLTKKKYIKLLRISDCSEELKSHVDLLFLKNKESTLLLDKEF